MRKPPAAREGSLAWAGVVGGDGWALAPPNPSCLWPSQRFAAVIMRIREPRTTALIFSSGKMVCTGAKRWVPAATPHLGCRGPGGGQHWSDAVGSDRCGQW